MCGNESSPITWFDNKSLWPVIGQESEQGWTRDQVGVISGRAHEKEEGKGGEGGSH